MQLIHKKTGYVVAEEKQDTLAIKDPFLLKDLQINGIAIPLAFRNEYQGKAVIRVDDPLFPKAFKEVYLKLHTKNEIYEWKENPSAN